jgi:hypothetical protein
MQTVSLPYGSTGFFPWFSHQNLEEFERKLRAFPAGTLDEALTLADKLTSRSTGYILPFGADVLPVVESREAGAR